MKRFAHGFRVKNEPHVENYDVVNCLIWSGFEFKTRVEEWFGY